MDIRYDYDFYRCLLIVDGRLTKEEFCKRAGAASGFSEHLFSGIYDSIFTESEDLKKSYEEYYRCEYPTFRDYIIEEFGMTPGDGAEFLRPLDDHPHLTLIRWDSLSYGNEGTIDFVFGEELGDKFIKILTGIQYEDKD